MGDPEHWQPIADYPKYQVSDLGRVRTGGKVIWQEVDGDGYRRVQLRAGSQRDHQRVHKLVYQAFVGQIPAGQEINHINGDKADNRPANLEVVDHQGNMDHAKASGLLTRGDSRQWANRIVGHRVVDPDQLLANPHNWRIHVQLQQDAVKGALDTVGWVQSVVNNVRTGHLVDGHLRVALALRDHQMVPVTDVDLSEAEERLILAELDSSTALAQPDPDKVDELLHLLDTDNVGLQQLFAQLADDAGLYQDLAPADSLAGLGAGSLQQQFVVPPFTVLDTRQGYWQDRRDLWLSLGIQSELGRTGRAFTVDLMKRELVLSGDDDDPDPDVQAPGTSVFDPVLTELVYRWFCPPGGSILDPFAGGSVRGIVAAALGRQYTGVDLSTDQVQANQDQWADIGPRLQIPITAQPAPDDLVPIKVSAASCRQLFHPCTPDYMLHQCRTACEFSSTYPGGTLITVHPDEQARIQQLGGIVVDGLLQPVVGPTPQGDKPRCPFMADDGSGLCRLHGTPDKPFGCRCTPFTLNANGTLIIRNRCRRLRCYKDTGALPAYIAHRGSLDLILGGDQAQDVCDHLDDGGGDVVAHIPRWVRDRMLDNDLIKHGQAPVHSRPAVTGIPAPQWIVGDSRDLPTLGTSTGFDLLFTCPPYHDLEQYSEDPRDLSTVTWDQFCADYARILQHAADGLAQDRFVAIVVGNVRDKRGLYKDLVGLTVQACRDAGLAYYNEAVLVNAVGSMAVRVGRQFSAGRKLGKVHQNVLVFVKGNAKRATLACGPVQVIIDDAVDADLSEQGSMAGVVL